MKRHVVGLGMMIMLSSGAFAGDIQGEYLEARNADIWTGPCFANGEVNIIGNKATMAWKVTTGSWEGVDLTGRSIVAVVFGNQTFGLGKPVQTRSVLIVDSSASSAQREALISLAKHQSQDMIQHVIAIETAPIAMATGYCDGRGCARLDTRFVKITTRCMHDKDSICGHEDLFYPILSAVDDSYAAYTIEHDFVGQQMNETFSHGNSRSAIIGHFSARPVPTVALRQSFDR
ncbi:DUF1326 domain-containing protein [bacterium]|nr:DUF1326 domain-containing protein [bacterium]